MYSRRKRHCIAKPAEGSSSPLSQFAPMTVFEALTLTDAELAARSGLESVLYLRFMRTLTAILVVHALLGLLILLPVYRAGGGGLRGVWSITAGNVQPGERGIWAAPAVVFVLSSVFAHVALARGALVSGATLRDPPALSRSLCPAASIARTVLVTGLPRNEVTDDASFARFFFAKLSFGKPGGVESARYALDMQDLPEKIAAYEGALDDRLASASGRAPKPAPRLPRAPPSS
eukprot:tig00020614_g12146.t1